MANTVRLHGGPWHGKEVLLPDGLDHFHIAGVELGDISFSQEDDIRAAETVRTRQGTYSRAHNMPHDFEWDGWE